MTAGHDAGGLEPLMEGARNAVAFMGIRPEYEVLIGYSRASDRRSVQAIATVIRDLGARLSLLEVEEPRLNAPTPGALTHALRGIDYYLDMGAGPGPHTLATYVPMFDYGVSMGGISAAPGFLESEAARWPARIWIEIHNLLKRSLSGAEPVNVTFHVTDERGTDLSYVVNCPEDFGSTVGTEPLEAGYWGDGVRPRVLVRAGFPPTHIPAGDLQYSGEGVLVVDTSNYFGRTPQPLRLYFDGGYCTRIDGGEPAEIAWSATLGRYRNANRLREMAITLHPKLVSRAPLWQPGNPVPLGMFPWAGTGDFIIALGGDTGVGGVDPGYEHSTTFFATTEGATITADGSAVRPGNRVIVDRGRLLILDDPGLREYARSFGDPDDLLAPARNRGDR
jgi:2,5-dihydroxypyridine 5,6-dioxygenase